MYTCGRSEKYFPKADEFLPERWERSSVTGKYVGVIDPNASLPYALGSRSCIGQKMAHAQMLTTLAKVSTEGPQVLPLHLKFVKLKVDFKVTRKEISSISEKWGKRVICPRPLYINASLKMTNKKICLYKNLYILGPLNLQPLKTTYTAVLWQGSSNLGQTRAFESFH